MKVDLAGAWSGLYSRLTSAAEIQGLMTLVTWVGVGMVVFAIGKWAWSRRRGSAQSGALGWPILVGAILASPNAIIPSLLWLADLGANTVVKLLA